MCYPYFRFARLFVVIVPLLIVSCSTGNKESQIDQNAALTIQALEAITTIQALEATNISLNATNIAAQSQPNFPPTDTTISISTQQQEIITTTEVPSVSSDIETPAVGESFESWMQTASILLYEDMVGDPRVLRYIKEALDLMNLQYEDVGNAQGWLKERLNIGAAGGRPWDLIIIATELRAQISGEYFEYLQNALDQNTSVIIESWYLDDISEGKARPILKACGVTVKDYSGSYGSLMDLVLWPFNGIVHPVLTEPNNYVQMTKGTYFWPPDDLGSLMYLSGEGDAVLLVGRKIDEPDRHGAVAVCMGGQLTLQTFSSHNYPRETMHEIWQNYIYNALKVRYSGKR
jgi:hypothetical protein